MTWGEIELQTFDCYYDCIVCDLDPYSPPREEDVQLNQMDEDVADSAVMLPTTVLQGSDHHYSYDDFVFFDTREKHEKLLRKNSVLKSHCQNHLYFYQKYIQKAKNNCDSTGGYRDLVRRANIGNRENTNISVGKKEA